MEITSLQRPVNPADIPLDRLAENTAVSDKQKVEEVGRQFEAVLLRQILAEAQKTTFKSKYTNDSTASTIYRDLTIQQLADKISRSGALGLGREVNQELTKQLPTDERTN